MSGKVLDPRKKDILIITMYKIFNMMDSSLQTFASETSEVISVAV